MTRAIGFVCAALLAVLPVSGSAGQSPAADSKTVTVTATIEAIDKATRTVTLKGPKGNTVEIKAPDQMEGFNSLKVGDQVTATYFEAVALNVRKSSGEAPPAAPRTMTQRKDRAPGSETRREQTFRMTVESVDPKAPSLTAKDAQGHVATLSVQDATQLQNIKPGDTVDVTYFESLLIKVERPRK